MSDVAVFDPERIFSTLARHEVEFVLVGALAARLQGFPRLTADADITPENSADNLERLAKALNALEARVYTDSVPEGLSFDCSSKTLQRSELWNLVTSAGRLDLVFRPLGSTGFADLRDGAIRFEVRGWPLYAASLQDLLRLKQASDRPQDRQDAIILREMLRANP